MPVVVGRKRFCAPEENVKRKAAPLEFSSRTITPDHP